jgi:hypothetical protein
MTSDDVKEALRRRHHAAGGTGLMVGEWTCVEELFGIDLLAWSAWGKHERVGYEVKISRSDYRRELLKPDKRQAAVERCTRFYFAVPDGLLTRDELAYREPGDLRPGDFERERCPGFAIGDPIDTAELALFDSHRARRWRPRYGGPCHRLRGDRTHTVEVPVPWVFEPSTEYMRRVGPAEHDIRTGQGVTRITCPTCAGKGYVAKSRVEQEAPTLWVPADVGLVVIKDDGSSLVKRKAPVRVQRALSEGEMAHAFRWASVRPDPRHTHDRAVALPSALAADGASSG